MKGVPQGRYTREFRQEAVKLVTEERLSLPEAALRLSLAPSTLGYWVKAQRAGKLGDVGKTYRPLTEVEMDLARTKKELAEVKMERDILKKGFIYNSSHESANRLNGDDGMACLASSVPVQRFGIVDFPLTVRAPVHRSIWESFLVLALATGG